MKVTGHEVQVRTRLLARSARMLGTAVLLGSALFFAADGVQAPFGPSFYRPKYTYAEVAEIWCADGRLLGSERPLRCLKGRRVRTLERAEAQEIRADLPPKMLRPKPPHPLVVAGLLGLAALVFWRGTRPTRVQLRSNGVLLGRRFVQADCIRRVRMVRARDLGWLVLWTDRGPVRSGLLRMPWWELDELTEELERLVLNEENRALARERQARLEPRMRALSESRST